MDLTTMTGLAHDLARHRVVTAEELRRAGADGAVVHRARRAEVLQAVPGLDGVYVLGPEPYDDAVRMHVAARWAGDGAVVSGLWVARLLALPWTPAGGTCLVRIDARYKRRGSEGFISVCRTVDLDRVAYWEFEGLRLACAPQAVIDSCRQVHREILGSPELKLREARGLVLGAVAAKRCSVEELEAVLGMGSVRHTADARRALTDAARGAASPPEAEVVDELLGYGVPFYCNVEVWVDGRLVAVLDFYLVGTGVGGEMDSEERHGDSDGLDATLVRHKTLEGLTLDIHHITPKRYRGNPTAYAIQLFTAARARLSAGRGDPPGVELRPRGPLLCGPRSSVTPYVLPDAAWMDTA